VTYFKEVISAVTYVDFLGGIFKSVVFGVVVAGVGGLRGLETGIGPLRILPLGLCISGSHVLHSLVRDYLGRKEKIALPATDLVCPFSREKPRCRFLPRSWLFLLRGT
jgi:hypothetical protein